MPNNEKKQLKKENLKSWLIVLVALADDVAILILILVVLWIFNIKISFPIVILMAVLLGAAVFVAHRAIVPSLRRRHAAGVEAMIGATAEVVESLNPCGLVRIAGECWQAKSASGEIGEGEEVEILSVYKLVLEVKLRNNDSG